MQASKPKIAKQSEIVAFLEGFQGTQRIHAKSLISTFFGDVVMPNDSFTWVETISAALAPLGVNERLVRTSLFRLREEGWVEATRSGRKSYYQLTSSAKSQTRLAERLIYYRDAPQWNGTWTLVFLVMQPLDAEGRNELEQELSWIGFGSVTKHVWAHPGAKSELVAERIARLGLQGKVICMRCENICDAELGFSVDDRELAALCLPIAEPEGGYQEFIKAFSTLLDGEATLSVKGSAADMLSLRLLMMDEFRRVVLRDPHLPLDLLPADWAGQRAYDLCAAIYLQIFEASNNHYADLQQNAGTALVASDGTAGSKVFTPVHADYRSRFLQSQQ